jgi:Spy/CpxP family protein refolding chaperone
MAILVAAALFASGFAIGALGVHLFYAQRIASVAGPPMPVGPMFERLLFRQLDLSDQQRVEVREILERSRVEADALRREMGPRLQTMNRQTAEAISEILTPEQREKMEELMARRQRRQRGFRPGEGPPPERRFGRRP